jgi:hypothetical protein
VRNPIEVKNRICVTQDEKPRVWFLKRARNSIEVKNRMKRVRNPIEVKNRICVTQDEKPRV